MLIAEIKAGRILAPDTVQVARQGNGGVGMNAFLLDPCNGISGQVVDAYILVHQPAYE